MLPSQYVSRWPTRLGVLALIALVLMAWYFYRERAAYADLAFHLFTYLDSGTFFIQNRRFVAGATQAVPLLGIRAGLSINQLMHWYSAAFPLYYALVFVGCVWWLRNEIVGLVLVLFFTLLATHTFYWAQSELPQAMVVLLFVYAGLSQQRPVRATVGTVALLALLPVAIIGHPLLVLSLLFVWGYDWLLRERRRDWGWYAFLAVGLATYAWRTATIAPGSYEAQRSAVPPVRDLLHVASAQSLHQVVHWMGGNFLLLPLSLIGLLVFYGGGFERPLVVAAAGRDAGWGKLRLVWVVAFVGGYLALICASYPASISDRAYFENMLLPLALFVALPLATEVLPVLLARPGTRRLAVWGLALLLVGRLVAIAQAHPRYTAYQRWLDQVMAYSRQWPERRFLMADANVDPHRLRLMTWGSAFETALLSARQHPDSVRTVFIATDLGAQQAMAAAPGQFLSPWQQYATAHLPARYLRLATNRPYRTLNTDVPAADTSARRTYALAHAGVQLTRVGPPRPLRAGADDTIRVRITVPLAAQPLHSGLGGAYPLLVRSVFMRDHWPTHNDPGESPLEIDVYAPWTQTLVVHCPDKAGPYELEVGIGNRGGATWPGASVIPVTVE